MCNVHQAHHFLGNLVISQSWSVIANRLSFIALLVIISLCYKMGCLNNIHCIHADDANVKVHKTYNDNETTAHLLQLFKDEGAHDAIADNQ